MHELTEGLSGIEVVVDDFIVIGCGSTVEEATVDHDKLLMEFLERCKEQGVRLNTDKLNLRVPFIGHIAKDKGLRFDPAKVRAISECQLQQTKLEFKTVRACAVSQQVPSSTVGYYKAYERVNTERRTVNLGNSTRSVVKKAIMSTPVLRYYNLQEEVALQCDASQFGLGSAILQNRHPVAYASRALINAETRYAKIEKELLAIVFACERFVPYVYGRDPIQVERTQRTGRSGSQSLLNSGNR